MYTRTISLNRTIRKDLRALNSPSYRFFKLIFVHKTGDYLKQENNHIVFLKNHLETCITH